MPESGATASTGRRMNASAAMQGCWVPGTEAVPATSAFLAGTMEQRDLFVNR